MIFMDEYTRYGCVQQDTTKIAYLSKHSKVILTKLEK